MDSSSLAILALSVYAGRLVTIAEGTHPFPSRTRSLSSPALTILQGQPCGTIRRCRPPRLHSPRRRLFASSFAHSLPLVRPETGKVTLPVHGYRCIIHASLRAGRLVTIAEGTHPFPSRTRSLSSPALTILQGQPCGTIRRCRPPRAQSRSLDGIVGTPEVT